MGKGDDPNATCAAAQTMTIDDSDSYAQRLIDEGPQAMSLCKPDRFPNEDDFTFDQEAGVAAVFDGMGGQANGAEASGGAARLLRGLISDLPAEGSREGHARELLEQLRGDLIARRTVNRFLGNADATAAIVLRDGDHLDIAWAGDTRAYLIGADGAATQLTDDHTLMLKAIPEDQRERVREILDEADSKEHARELGGEEAANAFYLRARVCSGLSAGDIGHVRVPAAGAAGVIVVSDGVPDNLRASQIQQITRKHAGRIQELPAALIRASDEASHHEGRGKPDDITCLLLTL